MKKRKYGWVPDLPDVRDFKYSVCRRGVQPQLPSEVDLRPKCPPVLDQANIGSCTAHAIANAHLFAQMVGGVPTTVSPSRLFIYYNERVLEGTVKHDAGAQLRDGIKSVVSQGVCPESEWPYVPNKFMTKPGAKCYADAMKYQVLQYQRLENTDLDQLKSCLAAGFPFVFGFTVYQSFEGDAVAHTGVACMPDPKESVCGGHAVLACGYSDSTERFLVMNSWGTGWGMDGYFTIPYEYLTTTDLADDFWTIRVVEQNA